MWFGELEKDEKIFIALENIKWREITIMWKTQISPKTTTLWNANEFKMDHPHLLDSTLDNALIGSPIPFW